MPVAPGREALDTARLLTQLFGNPPARTTFTPNLYGVEFDVNEYSCNWIGPAGGVIASVDDYAHLMEALLAGGGAVLTRASVEALEAEHAATQRAPPPKRVE